MREFNTCIINKSNDHTFNQSSRRGPLVTISMRRCKRQRDRSWNHHVVGEDASFFVRRRRRDLAVHALILHQFVADQWAERREHRGTCPRSNELNQQDLWLMSSPLLQHFRLVYDSLAAILPPSAAGPYDESIRRLALVRRGRSSR